MGTRITISLILLILLTSCNSLLLNKNRNIRLAKKYQEECIKKIRNTHNDTIQLKSNKVCIKGKNNRFSIGRIKNGIQFGVWYYYKKENESFKCYLIKKNRKKDSTIIYTSSLVNYRKW